MRKVITAPVPALTVAVHDTIQQRSIVNPYPGTWPHGSVVVAFGRPGLAGGATFASQYSRKGDRS